MSADRFAPHTSSAAAADPGASRQRRIVQALRVVYRAMQEHSRCIEREFGVSTAQLAALWVLADQPGARVSELSQQLALHQSTTSNMLDKLEKKGLIERRRGGPDQRVVQVYLNATGEELLGRAPRPSQGGVDVALTRLPEALLDSLDAGLTGLLEHMDTGTKTADHDEADTDDNHEFI